MTRTRNERPLTEQDKYMEVLKNNMSKQKTIDQVQQQYFFRKMFVTWPVLLFYWSSVAANSFFDLAPRFESDEFKKQWNILRHRNGFTDFENFDNEHPPGRKTILVTNGDLGMTLQQNRITNHIYRRCMSDWQNIWNTIGQDETNRRQAPENYHHHVDQSIAKSLSASYYSTRLMPHEKFASGHIPTDINIDKTTWTERAKCKLAPYVFYLTCAQAKSPPGLENMTNILLLTISWIHNGQTWILPHFLHAHVRVLPGLTIPRSCWSNNNPIDTLNRQENKTFTGNNRKHTIDPKL